MLTRTSALLCCLLLLSLSAPASAQVVAGTDCWQTDPGTAATIPPIPADFFGPGSDPFPGASIPVTGVPLTPLEEANCACPPLSATSVQWLDIHGDPVPAGSIHAVSQVPQQAPVPDTCIRRLATATFPGGVGVPEQVPIELVELSLQSVAPITITFGGGGSPTDFDVFITEDGPQPAGQMEFVPAQTGPMANGQVTVPNLPIQFQFRFEPVLPGPAFFLNGNVNMQNPNPQAPGSPGTFSVAGTVPAVQGNGLFILAGALLASIALAYVWRKRAASAGE